MNIHEDNGQIYHIMSLFVLIINKMLTVVDLVDISLRAYLWEKLSSRLLKPACSAIIDTS